MKLLAPTTQEETDTIEFTFDGVKFTLTDDRGQLLLVREDGARIIHSGTDYGTVLATKP